ncbi:MAG TPA: hypothetical protein V6D03_14910 [Candidatus Caenarcaniphilales bacterium]
MHKQLTLLRLIPQNSDGNVNFLRLCWGILLWTSLSVTTFLVSGLTLHPADAQTKPVTPQKPLSAVPAAAPLPLKNTLAQLDAAANQRNLKAVM